jgi:hypothetical protein
VPGDEEAGAEADGEEEEVEDEFDDPRADGEADLLEELPHAASRIRAAPAEAAMISPRRSRGTRQ